MKKILLMMVLITIPLTGNYNNAYAEKSKQPKKEIKKAERFDFRKVRWGMNKSQIRASEDKLPYLDAKNKIIYKDKMFETDISINYYFDEEKLIKSEYLFDGTFNRGEDYITYFRKIKKNLLDKYGKTSRDDSRELDIMEKGHYPNVIDVIKRGEQSYETVWETPTTNVKLSLIGKDIFTSIRLFVSYNSKKLREGDTVKEVEKSLF